KHGLVSRRCGADGQWVTGNGRPEGAHQLMVSFKVLYTVGYSLSLLTLVSALLVLTIFRKLRCTRNYIHANLFASFGLRATSVMVKDALLEKRWGMEVVQMADWEALLSHEAALGCRAAQVLMQYCILANHYWFLVEAVYLYKLLIGAVFSEKNYYRLYLYLGWGTPVVFVVPWMAAKYLKENVECWALNENMAYWWIIRIPILLASLINLLIFMRILKVILAKLRANQKGYADYKLRLAKATLTLIPLFGIHEVVFIFATDEQTTGVLRYVKVFFTLFLNSFQGFLVAVLYCFANKEVRTHHSFSCPVLGLGPASPGGFVIPTLACSACGEGTAREEPPLSPRPRQGEVEGKICLATAVSIGILALTNQTRVSAISICHKSEFFGIE
ncbi:PREDICTED: glucagon receptor-like, partial [Leptosomus discolor]|uniref:glucagon receptor-like n=1 Tax=Leptosomus discolor TaxID=188344 RepID=UPI0005225AEB